MNPALRDAGLSAAVALGLFLPMVGMVATNSDQGLLLTYRPIAVTVLVAMVFCGRLVIVWWRNRAGHAT